MWRRFRREGTLRALRSAAAVCLLPAASCYMSYRIEAERRDVADVPAADEAAVPDVWWPGCPVWAIPASTGDPVTEGSEAHPFVGLQQAVDERGDCNHIILRDGTPARPFAARTDITFDELEHDALTIEGDPRSSARAELDAAGGRGIAVYGAAGSLTLRHLAVRHGRGDQGAGLWVFVRVAFGEVRLEDTEWTDCHVGTDGGAVLIFSERIAVSDSVFADSSAETYGGGAVLDGPEELLVERSVFTDDTAPTGGGLWVGPFASVVVRDSVFARNVSTVAGGGIYGHAGDTTLQGNRFDQNVSFSGGGAAWEGMGSLEALWNVFAGNVAERGSACDVIAASDIGFHNNLVLRNAGSTACRLDARGGGVPVVANNAFVDNAGGEEAAHLWTPPSGSRPEVVANVFFGGEGDGAAVLSAPAAAAAHAAYNDFWDAPSPSFGGAVDEEATLYADPRFVAPERDDYRLAAGSPCVDAGDPAVARNDPDGTRNDIGAFGGPAGAWTPPPYP